MNIYYKNKNFLDEKWNFLEKNGVSLKTFPSFFLFIKHFYICTQINNTTAL
jgi:hypothetical protein